MKQIQIEGLTLRTKNKVILDSVDLEISEGDSVAILGPNGAGKTTLLNVMLNLQRFKIGKVRNDFLNLPAYKVGVHIQESKLNGLMKVREILDLFLFDGENEKLIKKYELQDKLNQKIATLSGGEKQKLLLVLTFQNSPEIICIDEVTTGLDVQSRKSIIDFIKKEIKYSNKTLIMVTHYLEEAEELCDKFLFLNNGKIVEFGRKEELFKKYNIAKNIYVETLCPIDFPEDYRIKTVHENAFSISINYEKEMLDVINYISENHDMVKRYMINEPSLEELYNSIICKEEEK